MLAKARDRGLVAPGAALSEEEIDNLIFLPAFSAADSISNISGRGVGMDVVKRNVQSLGGRISVQSRFGAGSRFTLSLPLTLAVLDGMVVSVNTETFIIPLTSIIESLRPRPTDIHPVVDRGDVLALRGEYVPLVHLYRCFSIENAITDPCCGIVIIVQSEGAGRIGVVVDELLGQQQVVVKSLEANYEPVDGISGATILGNGRVALILDVAGLREVEGDRPQHSRVSSKTRDIIRLQPANFERKRHMQPDSQSMVGTLGQDTLDRPAASDNTQQFITFTLGAEEYGIDIMVVREIKGWTDTTMIPNAPTHVRGVINLRGRHRPDLRSARAVRHGTDGTDQHACGDHRRGRNPNHRASRRHRFRHHLGRSESDPAGAGNGPADRGPVPRRPRRHGEPDGDAGVAGRAVRRQRDQFKA